MHAPSAPAVDLPTCNPALKFVRVLEQRPDGLVSFMFSIGWPELAVELMLPDQAFHEFCAAHQVQFLDAEGAGEASDTPSRDPDTP